MKKGYLIALVVIAIFVAVFVSTFGQASQYTTFDGAYELYKNNDDQEVHVIGELVKNEDGSLKDYFYDHVKDPNRCEFSLKDDSSRVERIILTMTKPTDFEKSEKVVVIGSFKDDVFVANNVLLKCPSKYEDKNLE
jgi:cytochrome c-type biogenesis protein CcmE